MEWVWRYYNTYKASRFARFFKFRRYRQAMSVLPIDPGSKVLEVGCGTGADFLRFAIDDGYTCYGLDHWAQEHLCADFQFVHAKAEKIPFPDRHFDAAVSIGVFEHIQPIETLCAAVSEISRVSKHYCIIVPSIGTPIEPHMGLFPFWSARDFNKRPRTRAPLNHFSDDAWLQFSGFTGARTRRFWYMPGIQNLMIYGSHIL